MGAASKTDRAGAPSQSQLGRIVAILEEVAASPRHIGISDLVRRTGIPRSTMHRLVSMLTKEELVEAGTSGFVPGAVLRRVAARTPDPASAELRALTIPYLVELHERTDNVAMLGVLDDEDVVLLEVVYGHRNKDVAPRTRRIPAQRSAMGRLLLALRAEHSAHLDGLAICRGELAPGVTEIAAPLVCSKLVAALGCMGPAAKVGAETIEVHRRVAQSAAAALRIATGRPNVRPS